MLPAIRLGTHARLPVTNRRKVGMTSSHHAPYVQGYTRATLAHTKGCDTARWSESQKVRLGSDWRLKLASMKAELLVIANQDRKSTRLNSSHANISYAVFCLKKKKKNAMTVYF